MKIVVMENTYMIHYIKYITCSYPGSVFTTWRLSPRTSKKDLLFGMLKKTVYLL